MEPLHTERPFLARMFSSVQNNPFLLHAIIEVPASIAFFLFPSRQLGFYSPQAHAVVRQYAVLLLASALIALSFAFRDVDDLSGQVAGALALYHVAPIVRATGKIVAGGESVTPWKQSLVLTVHGICFARLAKWSWEFYLTKVWAG